MKILLVDDHILFTEGLSLLLQSIDDRMEFVSARSIAAAVAAKGPFDLILLDYMLPDSEGGEGLRCVLSAHEGVTVVMLSAETRPQIVRQLIDQGAAGFISKASDTHTLMSALKVILAGGVYMPKEALAGIDSDARAVDALSSLTPRQLDCLFRAVQGKPNKIIAMEMGVTESTAKAHLSVGFKALGVNTRAEAVFQAATLGLLPHKSRLTMTR